MGSIYKYLKQKEEAFRLFFDNYEDACSAHIQGKLKYLFVPPTEDT